MPKEVIVSSEPNVAEGYETRVEVRWGRDQQVEINTAAGPDLAFEVMHQLLIDMVSNGEVPNLDPEAVASMIVERTMIGLGWGATLSRTQVNQLIRNLRRARDQAYGADA